MLYFAVELELAVFEDAVDKFAIVLERPDETSHAVAAYGQGIALLSIAERDLQDGKAGSAFSSIRQAIDNCLNFSVDFACTRKLLGDLYSFGASLPPNVFNESESCYENVADECIQKQLQFVSKGEDAFRSTMDAKSVTDDDFEILQASTICDLGSNILLQAQVLSSRYESGSNTEAQSIPELDKLYERASSEFEKAIDKNALYAPAWCGLGCSNVKREPLLAQHAFCRCLQLEKMFPDAFANIGFLYTSHEAFEASESVMNALTQVADTPMMWINRAFMLERHAATNLENSQSQAERNMAQAADAYRAALQVMKLPDAQLGLSLAGRMITEEDGIKDEKSRSVVYTMKRKDTMALLKEFVGASYQMRQAVSLIGGVMKMEQATDSRLADWSEELFGEGQEDTKRAIAVKDLGVNLNLDVVVECIDKKDNESQVTSRSLKFPVEVSLKRQILHEPGRADLWLLLAKNMLNSLDESNSNAVESAVIAANRACTMMTEELTNPRRVANGVVSSVISSEMISEGLSLLYWLQNLQNKKDEAPKNTSTYELQRSLIMCPNNRLGREALQHGH